MYYIYYLFEPNDVTMNHYVSMVVETKYDQAWQKKTKIQWDSEFS